METAVSVICPKCHTALPDDVLQRRSDTDSASCPACRAPVYVSIYPRLRTGVDLNKGAANSHLSGEGDAVCRFYPELKAETVCDECGCFLSEKAAVTWSGRSFCMPCLHSLRENKGQDEFLAKRTLYDNTALGLVLFLSPLSLFTAPVALYYLIRYRNSSRGMVPRGKFRWFLALILSIGFVLGWLFLLVLWIAAIADSFK